MNENNSMQPLSPHFPTGKREILHLFLLLALCLPMANFVLYGGLNLGFAVIAIPCFLASHYYLGQSNAPHKRYRRSLLALGLVVFASFVRSDDGFVKAVMLCFLLLACNLSLTLTAGKNRFDPKGITSLAEVPFTIFNLGVGELPSAFGGLSDARRNAGEFGKKNMAVLAGLAAAIPLVAILIPLLMRADAAFEGLLNLLPEFDFSAVILSVIFGVPTAFVIYTRNTALKHAPKKEASGWTPRSISHLTVNTALIAVSILYVVYLLSQLAYFVGGFSGILPEEFTMAEYARRGFFEMALLSAINLAIMTAAMALSNKDASRLTRILCLFIGIVSLFFIATASAKMFLYIDSYGLTRLRLLVQVIISFIALTVIFVCIWLFRPKFAYMKAIVLTALLIGSIVAWADVDTVVAAYNVRSYQSGQLQSIDMGHLCSLGDGAVPFIAELTNDPNLAVRTRANHELLERRHDHTDDLRSWNIASAIADAANPYQ